MAFEATKIALIQMRCGADPEENFARAVEFHSRRGEARRADRLFAGAFSVAIFLPDGRSQKFRAGRGGAGKIDIGTGRRCAGNRRRNRRVTFRETRRRCVSQHGRNYRRERRTARQISQDAHSGRSALSRKILFRAGRSRISSMDNRAGKNWRLRLLGPMVSGSGATNRVARCGNHFLSNGNRLASERKKRIRCGAIFCLGNDSAQSRDCEWLLRRGGKSRRP